MALISSFFILFSSLALLLLVVDAQGRAPHGLVYENPTAFSPSAVDFFHPKGQETQSENPCTSCSPLPVAAQVEANKAQESAASTSRNSGNRLGGGGVAGVVFGLAFMVVLAMGAYYVFITRRTNMSKANSVQPDA